jgi:hypothetical protein
MTKGHYVTLKVTDESPSQKGFEAKVTKGHRKVTKGYFSQNLFFTNPIYIDTYLGKRCHFVTLAETHCGTAFEHGQTK